MDVRHCPLYRINDYRLSTCQLTNCSKYLLLFRMPLRSSSVPSYALFLDFDANRSLVASIGQRREEAPESTSPEPGILAVCQPWPVMPTL